MQYHEDLEVHEGKAEWLPLDESSPWASPSFVVDQAGKGLLGRPVRDYRVVNSWTLDHAWPTPNAEDILRRAQNGSLHTKMDCVWGFTQIGIAESTQELLTLVCTRGLLRPKVLYFGAKQCRRTSIRPSSELLGAQQLFSCGKNRSEYRREFEV